MRFSVKIPIICYFIPLLLFGQETKIKDSTSLPLDTVVVDSSEITRDTTSSVSGVDTVVIYSSADSIVYSIETKTMSLYSEGNIKYQAMELEAGRIDINWDTSTLTAFGIQDTSDTTQKRELGLPVMKDRGEVYDGKELGYNFKTKRGRILIADTKMDEGFYHGERLKKIGKDVLFVADGRYTTCDKAEPHYYFYSPKMKVTLQEKVIAEPIYMYIADVPVFWFPVAVFPSKGGRRSGIIAPAIAEDAAHGRLLRHIGYYWAINDYMDWSIKTDLYTKGSWALFSNYQYNLRYYFSGGLSGEYRKMLEGESSDPNRKKNISYNVHISHHQEINPTMRADVNFTFASNNSYRNTNNINQALNQDITSNATISKSWEGTPNSVNINVSRRQNLINGNITETLPSLNFNHSQSYPFRSSKKKSADPSDLSWYELIGVSYHTNFSNNRAKTKKSINGILTNINGVDTLTTVEDYRFDRNYRLTQGVSMSIAPKLGYFTISPSMNYNDQRSFSDNDIPDSSNGHLITRKDRLWSRSGTFSSGVSASTKVYGIVQPGFLGVEALRHTVSPSLSFMYSKQVIGENLPPKQMVMSFNVGNNFEMKTTPEEDGKEGKKIQLLNLSTGISYNFAADSLNFSPFSLNYRTSIGNILDIGGSTGFDLYKLEQVSPGYFNKVNKFLLIEEGRLARMTNFSVSLSTSLSGEKQGTSRDEPSSDTLQRQLPKSAYRNLLEEEEPDFSIPWRLSLSWDYSENKVPPSRSRTSNLRGNLEFNLTANWKFSVSGGYDIMNREVVVPQINISRDLHCWMMDFTWRPMGAYRFYSFEIRLKAPQLQDIKVTKTGSASGIY
ncbi:MAG: LPS-assembly protein LptD [Ignavibacteriales bacterium]|nr:LPS-assembly protein LptD [Ignavibacteriales bacterium]